MENNPNPDRRERDNWVDAHPEIYPNIMTEVIEAGVRKSFSSEREPIQYPCEHCSRLDCQCDSERKFHEERAEWQRSHWSNNYLSN
jgi:hypothetical protein